MNKDEVIEIAKQAGFYINDELTITSPFIEDICISPMLKEFAKLVAEKEREACAKICDEFYKGNPNINYSNTIAICIRGRTRAK